MRWKAVTYYQPESTKGKERENYGICNKDL